MLFFVKDLAANGKKGFYEGRVAQAICDAVTRFGGVMSLEDLKGHETTFDEPIKTDYKGYTVWEIPPNGQGITALMALNILDEFNLKGKYRTQEQTCTCNEEIHILKVQLCKNK